VLEYYTQIPIEFKIVAGICIVAFLIQMFYVLMGFSVVRYRLSRRTTFSDEQPPISIIITTGDNWEFVEKRLPIFLSQDYPNFEIIVVANDCSEDFIDELNRLASNNDKLKVSLIKRFSNTHSNKLALTVGMKAAQYELMLFTTADSYPVSDQWIKLMAKGFSGKSITLGYCGVKGNIYMRCSQLGVSMRWLIAAVTNRTYRGSVQNIGYTKDTYFESNGFTHLRLKYGVDDLFIQKVATKNNVAVILHPAATIRQDKTSMSQWRKERTLNSYSFRYYPSRVKVEQAAEFLTRSLLFICWAILAAKTIIDKQWILLSIVTLLPIIRMICLLIVTGKFAKRVGERKILWFYPIYDFISPLSEMALAIGRRIKPSSQLWI
jgi:glycosyltransferase involved in cell wall biosynthesis